MTIVRPVTQGMRVNLQPAYVMHSRPYRDSSALLDVFTAEYGRVAMVARGNRRPSRKGSVLALLQPFVPLLLSFSGRSELKTLVATEPAQGLLALRGERMFSGMYMNELLVRLLHRNDAHPALFAAYDQTLKALACNGAADAVLRRFEFTLLDELGYGFDPGADGTSGQPIDAKLYYRYAPGIGLVVCHDIAACPTAAFTGSDLLTIASGEFDGSVRLSAKRLLREALAVHLGGVPLRSRELFRLAGARSLQGTEQERQSTSASAEKP